MKACVKNANPSNGSRGGVWGGGGKISTSIVLSFIGSKENAGWDNRAISHGKCVVEKLGD